MHFVTSMQAMTMSSSISMMQLLSRVATLKSELLEWRTKLDGQVKSFREVSAEDRTCDPYLSSNPVLVF